MSPRARLLVDLAPHRYRTLTPEARAPRAGDEVTLDQGLTSPDGRPMVIVYFPSLGAASQYEAEVYESELGPDIESSVLP